MPAGPWHYFGGGLENRCGQRFPGGGAADCDDGLRVLCAAVDVAFGGGKSGCWSADYVGRCQCRYYSLGGSSLWVAGGTDNYFAVVVVVVDSFPAAFWRGEGGWWRRPVDLGDFSCSCQTASLISWCTHNPRPPVHVKTK